VLATYINSILLIFYNCEIILIKIFNSKLERSALTMALVLALRLLNVLQVPANFYVFLILALANAMIEGLTLHLLLIISLFFICPVYNVLLRFIHTLFILALFLFILCVFGVTINPPKIFF
jgi:hypothetical protein